MTRRILLVLDESVTATGCRDCSSRDDYDQYGAFNKPLSFPSFGVWSTVRLPECLAAEAKAERCVEMPPEYVLDAVAVIASETPIGQESDDLAAWLDEMHAAKARGGGGHG